MIKIPKQKKSGIPLIGLGTWKLKGQECEKCVTEALDLGYRHIDTADVYDNHRAIGKVIKGVPRNELYLVSKLYLHDLSREKVKAAVPRILEELDIAYLDLLLIHWPHPSIPASETLTAMMDCRQEGLVRSIGVSNFVRSQLDGLNQFPLLANQIEMHPYLQRKELVQDCLKRGIPVTAYRPLAKGAFEQDPVLIGIGKKYGKSPSQIALRWLIENNIAAIPKASSLQHMKDNISIFDFELDAQDRALIEQLDSGQRFCAPDGMQLLSD